MCGVLLLFGRSDRAAHTGRALRNGALTRTSVRSAVGKCGWRARAPRRRCRSMMPSAALAAVVAAAVVVARVLLPSRTPGAGLLSRRRARGRSH
jgi:hypothetical protein